jgi:hypothetical protein
MADLEIINAIIAAGTTISTPVGIGFKAIVGFVMPSVWASGALTFRVSPDGVSFLPYVDVNNAAITISTPAAGTFISIDPKTFAGVNELELVCATAPANAHDRDHRADGGALKMATDTLNLDPVEVTAAPPTPSRGPISPRSPAPVV